MRPSPHPDVRLDLREGTRTSRAALLAIALAAAALILIGLLLKPAVLDGEMRLTLFGLVIPNTCWLKLTTGIPCAGCGLTRSIVLLLHGRLAASVALHPFGPWIVALALLALPPHLARRGTALPRWTSWWNRAWLVLTGMTGVLMLVWWIRRVGLSRLVSAVLGST